MRRFLVLVFSLFVFHADAIETKKEGIEVELRIRHLEEKLRCLVCQNQTLADSNAELAGDLRRQVREQVNAGRSDGEIVEYLVQRYGDFVLYKPPLRPLTWLLWFGPLLLVAGVAAAIMRARSRNRQADATLDASAQRQLADLLDESATPMEHRQP